MSVTDTSRSAYDGLRSSLPRREQLVWNRLKDCHEAPTAYELMLMMKQSGDAFDLNSTRPRLCALYGKGCVRRIGKRKCSVTGRLAYTWQAVPSQPPVVQKPDRKADPTPQDARLW